MRGLACALVLVCAASAVADVDVTIGNGVKVAGTFDPGSETESFRFVAPADAVLSVVVKGKKSRGSTLPPAPRIALFDPDDDAIGASATENSTTGSKLAGLTLQQSGEYRVVISSDGQVAGNYQLQVAWKVPKKVSFEGTVSAVPAKFTISLPAGAVATFTASSPKGSVVRPWVSAVEGGEFSQGFTQPPVSMKHKATMAEAPFTGEYVVSVANQGAQGGGIVYLAVAIKAPKPVKKTVTIGSTLLAKAGTALPVARGELIGRDGGAVDIGGLGTPIDGASVTVPAGALSVPTPIVVGTGSPIPGADDQSAAGPTILFGPEGTEFARDVTITIPFDPALLAASDIDALVVLTRDKQGKESLVPKPYEIDAVAGTISFASSHFSSYRAFVPALVPSADLDGDGIDDLVIPAPLDTLRRGAVFVFKGRADTSALSGATTEAFDYMFTGVNQTSGPTPGDTFGAAAATGDVNDDGVADLVVGASRADSGHGAVYVFFGGTNFASRSSSAADVTLTASASDARFGATLLVADATGDGIADIVVGSPWSSTANTDAGNVYVFPGGQALDDASVGDTGVLSSFSPIAGGHFGVSLAVGDLTADGKPDLAVGADERDASNAGEVFVFSDASSMGQGSIASVVAFAVSGDQFLGSFGSAIAIGDLDRDGTDDLIVGAPYSDLAPSYDSGQLYVFAGGPTFGSISADQATFGLLPPTTTAGDYLGESIVLANFLGDGAPDLLVGSRGASAGLQSQNGVVNLTLGGPSLGGEWQLEQGRSDGDGFGLLLPPADINGDGYLDALVAAPVADGYAGRVRVYLGPGIKSARFEIVGVGIQRLGARDIHQNEPGKR